VVVILFHKIIGRDGINQNLDGIIISPIAVLNQFNDIDQLDEGSKEENRFIIIFS
jgi:hypothetical protein